ncbi:hypothetical protein ACFXBB_31210 [Streptomyces scopuliridis]|uniref:hypothetical protein n=1 Tax=Streptomyces scopuliridis TaxID=452529 RepID=UPI00369E7E35
MPTRRGAGWRRGQRTPHPHRFAKEPTQGTGEMAAGFGKQVPPVEQAAAVHHEHARGDLDSRQGDIDHRSRRGPG